MTDDDNDGYTYSCPQIFVLLPAWRMVLSNVVRNVAQNSSSLSTAFPTQPSFPIVILLTTILALALRITFLIDKYRISQSMNIEYLWCAQCCVSMLGLVLGLRALKYLLGGLPQMFRAFKASREIWIPRQNFQPDLLALYTTECLHNRRCWRFTICQAL